MNKPQAAQSINLEQQTVTTTDGTVTVLADEQVLLLAAAVLARQANKRLVAA